MYLVSRSWRRWREKVVLPLFLGPHIKTVWVCVSPPEATVSAASDQSCGMYVSVSSNSIDDMFFGSRYLCVFRGLLWFLCFVLMGHWAFIIIQKAISSFLLLFWAFDTLIDGLKGIEWQKANFRCLVVMRASQIEN